jgi:hypothetical protein
MQGLWFDSQQAQDALGMKAVKGIPILKSHYQAKSSEEISVICSCSYNQNDCCQGPAAI